MKYLLDTHAFIWAVASPQHLPKAIRDLLKSNDTEVFCSVISVWEIAIKKSLKRIEFPIETLEGILDKASFSLLPLELSHTKAFAKLPPLHRDPFDRMLIAQAKSEGFTIITRDSEFDRYGVSVFWKEK